MRTEIPTAICENDAMEKATTMIANNSQRIAPEFLFMACASTFVTNPPTNYANAIVPQKATLAPKGSSHVNTGIWSMLLSEETLESAIWKQRPSASCMKVNCGLRRRATAVMQ